MRPPASVVIYKGRVLRPLINLAERAGFEPACRFRQTDFESVVMSDYGCFVGAFQCRWDRSKWLNNAGLMAIEWVERGFEENDSLSTFCGYLLARC